MIRDLVRRLVARLWPDHSGQRAALDGGPGPELTTEDKAAALGRWAHDLQAAQLPPARRPVVAGSYCNFRWGASGSHLCDEAPGHDGDHMCRCYAKARPQCPEPIAGRRMVRLLESDR